MLIPDHETTVDFLNYEAISRTVVELLKDNRKRALTVGMVLSTYSLADKLNRRINHELMLTPNLERTSPYSIQKRLAL